MKLRFYSAITLGLLAIALSLYDIYIEPNPNVLRAGLGILVGLVVIVIAFAAAMRKGESNDQETSE